MTVPSSSGVITIHRADSNYCPPRPWLPRAVALSTVRRSPRCIARQRLPHIRLGQAELPGDLRRFDASLERGANSVHASLAWTRPCCRPGRRGSMKAPLGSIPKQGLNRCCSTGGSGVARRRGRRRITSVPSISRSGAVNDLCRGQPARPALQNERLLTRHAPGDGQKPHWLAAHGTEEVFVAELHRWPSERKRGATVIHIKLLGA
jgi:hypothetical protein